MDKKQLVKHLVTSLVLGLLIAIGFDHVIFHTLNPLQDRSPEVVQLVIPAGTTQQISQGQNPPSIPTNMTFLVGDTLQVKNEDSFTQQLGPLIIPPGSTSSLKLGTARLLMLNCSFKSTKFLGLDVRPPDTILSRILSTLAIGLPATLLLAVYGLIVFPKKKEAS